MLVSTYQERLQTTYSEIALLNYSNQSRPQCPYQALGLRPAPVSAPHVLLSAAAGPRPGCRCSPLPAEPPALGEKRGALQQQVLSTVRLRTSLKQCFKIPVSYAAALNSVSYAAALNSECSLCRGTGKPYGFIFTRAGAKSRLHSW